MARRPQAAAAAETKEIAKKGGSSLALPDFMAGMAGMGTEVVDTADVEIPRLMLLQALSPQVEEGDYKAGQFFHTLLEESFGDSLRIIPVFSSVKYFLFRPRDDGGGVLARAEDGVHWSPANGSWKVSVDKKTTVEWKTARTVKESGLAEWGSFNPEDEDSQPAATKMYCVVAMSPDHPDAGPFVITLQRSSAKVGAKLMGKLKMSNAPSFGLVYRMESVNDSNSNNQSFKNFRFTGEGFVQDSDLFEQAKHYYERFKDGYAIREDDEFDDADPPEKSAGGGSGKADSDAKEPF